MASYVKDEIFQIKYYPDEIRMHVTDCLQPWNCTCHTGEPKCGYKAEELQKKFIEYYQQRVEYIKKMTPTEFLSDYGYYDE